MAKTIALDDLEFIDAVGLNAFKVRLFEDGEHAATVIVTPAMLQIAIHRAIKALEARQGREANVVAFGPLPRAHAADSA